jgi:hypothetical protein
MNADRKGLDEISERVIGCAFTVANALGTGFLEKVYENALAHELTKAGLMVRQQIAIGVEYDGVTLAPTPPAFWWKMPCWWKSRRSEPWIRTTTLNA